MDTSRDVSLKRTMCASTLANSSGVAAKQASVSGAPAGHSRNW